MADYLILPVLSPVTYQDGDTPIKFIARMVAQAEEARSVYEEAKEDQNKQEDEERKRS